MRWMATGIAIAASFGCVTYESAMDRIMAEWSAAENRIGADNRKFSLHSAYVPKENPQKVLSFSMIDGRKKVLEPLQQTNEAMGPLLTLRFFELARDPPRTSVYRKGDEQYRAFTNAASGVINEVFGNALRVNADIVIVPADARLREIYESGVEAGVFSVRFYMPEENEAWIARHRSDLKTLSHELYHAYDQLGPAGEGDAVLMPTQARALGEASASLFAKCVELDAFHRATVYRDPIPTYDGRTIDITDAQLLRNLDTDYEQMGLTTVERRIMGDVFAWAIWLDLVGPKWEVSADEASANGFASLCTKKVIGDRSGLADILRKMAMDSKDPPPFDIDSEMPG